MRIEKPRRIVPISFFLSLFEVIISKIPIAASMGVKDSGLKRRIKTLSPLIEVVLRSHAVTVVPTLAPKIMPMV